MVLEQREKDYTKAYEEKKQEMTAYRNHIMVLQEKLKAKSDLIAQKEQEIAQWSETYLFKDLLSHRDSVKNELELYKKQKEQMIREQQEKDLQHLQLEKVNQLS